MTNKAKGELGEYIWINGEYFQIIEYRVIYAARTMVVIQSVDTGGKTSITVDRLKEIAYNNYEDSLTFVKA